MEWSPELWTTAHDSLRRDGAAGLGGAAAAPASPAAVAILTRKIAAPIDRRGATVFLGVLVRPVAPLHAGAGYGFFNVMLDWGGNREYCLGAPGAAFGKVLGIPPLGPPPEARQWMLLFDTPAATGITEALIASGRPVSEKRLGVWVGESVGHCTTCGVSTGRPIVAGRTTLLVLRAEFSRYESAGRFSLFVDPAPGDRDPAPVAAFAAVRHGTDGTVPMWVTLASSGAFVVDELRVARTLHAACGFPEPPPINVD